MSSSHVVVGETRLFSSTSPDIEVFWADSMSAAVKVSAAISPISRVVVGFTLFAKRCASTVMPFRLSLGGSKRFHTQPFRFQTVSKSPETAVPILT